MQTSLLLLLVAVALSSSFSCCQGVPLPAPHSRQLQGLDTWVTAPACVGTLSDQASQADSMGRLWGWSKSTRTSCAWKDDQQQPLFPGQPTPPLDWATATACPEPASIDTAAPDRTGRLWGVSQGKSCAFKPPGGTPSASTPPAAPEATAAATPSTQPPISSTPPHQSSSPRPAVATTTTARGNAFTSTLPRPILRMPLAPPPPPLGPSTSAPTAMASPAPVVPASVATPSTPQEPTSPVSAVVPPSTGPSADVFVSVPAPETDSPSPAVQSPGSPSPAPATNINLPGETISAIPVVVSPSPAPAASPSPAPTLSGSTTTCNCPAPVDADKIASLIAAQLWDKLASSGSQGIKAAEGDAAPLNTSQGVRQQQQTVKQMVSLMAAIQTLAQQAVKGIPAPSDLMVASEFDSNSQPAAASRPSSDFSTSNSAEDTPEPPKRPSDNPGVFNTLSTTSAGNTTIGMSRTPAVAAPKVPVSLSQKKLAADDTGVNGKISVGEAGRGQH